ncbi:hypothetical protein [Pseudomonas schmalbachii]|nr:hypothetical protein [Pseudomonas schmalbachii]
MSIKPLRDIWVLIMEITIKVIRYLLIFIVATAIAIAGLIAWGDRWGDGVERGSWRAFGMPDVLNGFPAYDPCGPVTQRYKGRDGERWPAFGVSYCSAMSAPELLSQYRSYMDVMGCETILDEISSILGAQCPKAYMYDVVIGVKDDGRYKRVNVDWFGED